MLKTNVKIYISFVGQRGSAFNSTGLAQVLQSLSLLASTPSPDPGTSEPPGTYADHVQKKFYFVKCIDN